MISMIRRYGRLQAKSALLSVAVMGCCMMPSLQAQGPYPTGCYTFPNYSQCHPTQGGSCSHYLNNVTPVGLGAYYGWTTTTCCGTYIWTPQFYEGACEFAELWDPAAVKQLLALSKDSQVMIPSCDGFIRRAPSLTTTPIEPSPMSPEPTFGTEKISFDLDSPTRQR